VLIDLIRRGFFESSRSITQVVLHVNRMGFHFTARELTPVLFRLMQVGILARSRNSQGQYQYHEG
jgi:hypothetical protein